MNAQLMQSLEEGFRNVDYNKWQRKEVRRKTPAVHWGHAYQQAGKRSKPSGKKQVTTSPECQNLLKMRVETQRAAVHQQGAHCTALLQHNRLVAMEITRMDESSYTCARTCLTLHERLTNSVASLNHLSLSQIEQAKDQIKAAEDAAREKQFELQKQLSGLEEKLLKAKAELLTLQSYQEKDYDIRALQIKGLRRKIEHMKHAQQDEREEVTSLFQTHSTKLEDEMNKEEDEIILHQTQRNVARIPPIIHTMLSHNAAMKTEIDLHRKVVLELQDRNQKLVQMIKELRVSHTPASNAILGSILQADKCTPDMELALDIPREEWMPM